MNATVVDLIKAAQQNGEPLFKGDFAGHEFHGNQYSGGSGTKQKTDYTNKQKFEDQHRKMYPKATQSEIDIAHANYVSAMNARKA